MIVIPKKEKDVFIVTEVTDYEKKEYTNKVLNSKGTQIFKEFDKIEAMISSMTKKERRDPKILNASRRKRIAQGSGTQVHDINKFMESFEMTQKMMKQMKNKGQMRKMMKNMKLDQMDEFKDLM